MASVPPGGTHLPLPALTMWLVNYVRGHGIMHTHMNRLRAVLMVGLVGLVGCTAPESANEEVVMEEPEEIVLGPADGHDLIATDLERVAVGAAAPDFTLASLAGAPVTLSDYRGEKDVVLVFYRGHW